jgi:hypothetical protein
MEDCMRKNMGAIDRTVRVALALAVGVLAYLHVLTGPLAVVLGIVALVFVATGLVGFCPIYAPFGIKTCKVVNPVEVAQTQLFNPDGTADTKPRKN